MTTTTTSTTTLITINDNTTPKGIITSSSIPILKGISMDKTGKITVVLEQDRSEYNKRLESRLSFLIKAIAEEANLSIKVLWQGKPSAFTDLEKRIVQISPYYDYDADLGLMYHELGHVIFTKCLKVKEKIFANEFMLRVVAPNKNFTHTRDDIEILIHLQLNSLEDCRIERAMKLFFPAAEYHLDYGQNHWRKTTLQNMSVGNITHPMMALHFYLIGYDILRLVPSKKCREAIKSTAEWLKEKNFDTQPSTNALFPLACEAFERLYPFYPPSNGENSSPGNSPCEGDHGSDSPLVEVIEEWTDGSNKPLHSPEVSEFLKQKKSGKFPSFPKPPQAEKIPYQKRLKYEGDKIVVRPVKAEIETFKRQNSEAEYPVPDVGLAVKQGRALGRKLRRILQLKEDSQKHRRSGKLDLKEAVRQISRYGSISSPRIFRRDIRNSWQHSVGILVDFSGSMSHSRKLERAKAAALVLASVMEELHLPYFIRGFCAKPGQNHIADIIMKDFGEGLSINRLNKAIPPKSWDVNRDSDSIRNAGKALSAYGRGVKILFVISDGMPNHQDGMQERSFMIGNTPIMDTRNAVDEMQKLGIQVVGIAIEQEAKGCMNQIYPTSFYVKDLDDLSRQLLRIYADKIKPLLG